MDINQLKYFISVAKHENMTHAAESLYISQPSLSSSMKRLEDELGTKLFERRHNSLKLTAAGEIFFSHAEKAIFEVETAKNRIQHSKNIQLNKVTVIMHPMISQSKLVKSALEAFPSSIIQLLALSPATTKYKYNSKDVDLYLSSIKYDPDNEYYHLCDEKLVLLIPETNPLSELEEVPISALKEEKWALYPETGSRFTLIANYCLQEGFFPKVSFSSTSLIGLCAAARFGDLITVVPQSTVDKLDTKGLKAVKVSNEDFCFPFYIEWSKNHELAPHVEEVKNFIIQFYQNNPMSLNISN